MQNFRLPVVAELLGRIDAREDLERLLRSVTTRRADGQRRPPRIASLTLDGIRLEASQSQRLPGLAAMIRAG